MLKSLVFSLRTTVRGTRDSLREADQTFSVRLRIIGSVSDNGTSCSKVSSAEIDLGGLFGTTWRCRGTRHRDARHSGQTGHRASEAPGQEGCSPSLCQASQVSLRSLCPRRASVQPGSGNRNVPTSSGWITKSPSGFRQSEASLARNLFGATPADAVRLNSWRICSRVAVGKPVLFS